MDDGHRADSATVPRGSKGCRRTRLRGGVCVKEMRRLGRISLYTAVTPVAKRETMNTFFESHSYNDVKQAVRVATQYAPAPASLITIISCKYENRQRLQFTTEFAKTQTTTRKISTVLFYQVWADTVKV